MENSSLFKSIISYPLLLFLVFGGIGYAAYAKLKPVDRETIVITNQTIDTLVQMRESISQTPVSAEERQEIVANHIEEEILIREAYRRGFDKNDYRVRKRLLNIMRTSLTDIIAEPSAAQLRAYYEENAETFATDESISLEQVYFSFDSQKLPQDPSAFIQSLEQTSDHSTRGDFSMTGGPMKEVSYQRLASVFGKAFTERVFYQPLNEWIGPIESINGIHYVKVVNRHEPLLPPFEPLESFVRSQYFLEKGRESQRRKIEEFSKRYQVVVEGAANK